MATVLALSGSPSQTSRTALLTEYTAAALRARGHQTHVLALRDLPAARCSPRTPTTRPSPAP